MYQSLKILLVAALIVLLLGSFSLNSIAKGTAGKNAVYESRNIVQMPNAGMLAKGSFLVYSEYFASGGLMMQIGAAPFNDFNLGISFSGSNFVGYGDVETQKYPGVQLSYRIINESLSFPAFLVGVNTQGRGDYMEEYEAFQIMSPGLYLAASKSFKWALGEFSLHAGVNYSIEGNPNERNVNFYSGIEHFIGNSLSLNIEYNATTTRFSKNIMKDKGLLNASFRVSLSDGLTVELQTLDLLENLMPKKGFRRSVCVEYIQKL